MKTLSLSDASLTSLVLSPSFIARAKALGGNKHFSREKRPMNVVLRTK